MPCRCGCLARQIRLTKREFELLRFLVENRNRVLSRDRLLERVWGLDRQVETRSVDVHVGRLRGKLGQAGRQIETVIGMGYRFVEEPESAPPSRLIFCCPWRCFMGRSVALYLFDVAEAIDLQRRGQRRSAAASARSSPPSRRRRHTSDIRNRRSSVRRRRRRRPVDRRVPYRLQGVRLRHHLAASDSRLRRHVERPRRRRPISSSKTKRSNGRPSRRAAAVAERLKHGHDRAAPDRADRGLSRVRDQRAEPPAHRRRSRGTPRRRDRVGASRRARHAQPPGAGRDSAPSDLVPARTTS